MIPKNNVPPKKMQFLRPFGRQAPRRIYPLPPEKVQPMIRIAHRMRGPLNIPERVILDHEFVLFVDGSGVLRIADTNHQFGPHHLFLLPPFVPHAIISERCDHVAVHFDFAPGLPPFAQSPQRRRPYEVQFTQGLRLPMQVVTSPSDVLEAMFLELLRVRDSDSPLRTLEAASVLTRILLLLLKKPVARGDVYRIDPGARNRARNRARIARAVAYAAEHLVEKPSAQHLATAAGLSLSHFNRLFSEWTGHSPIEYLRRLRVERARQLLADIDLSIKEIAIRCGFDDAYHFSRTFRQIDGLPPTKYRGVVLANRSR